MRASKSACCTTGSMRAAVSGAAVSGSPSSTGRNAARESWRRLGREGRRSSHLATVAIFRRFWMATCLPKTLSRLQRTRPRHRPSQVSRQWRRAGTRSRRRFLLCPAVPAPSMSADGSVVLRWSSAQKMATTGQQRFYAGWRLWSRDYTGPIPKKGYWETYFKPLE